MLINRIDLRGLVLKPGRAGRAAQAYLLKTCSHGSFFSLFECYATNDQSIATCQNPEGALNNSVYKLPCHTVLHLIPKNHFLDTFNSVGLGELLFVEV